VAGVAAWGRVAPFVWRDRLPHVVMVAVMAYTMLGERSPLKCLVGAAVLIAASVAMAPLARWSAAYRGHVWTFVVRFRRTGRYRVTMTAYREPVVRRCRHHRRSSI